MRAAKRKGRIALLQPAIGICLLALLTIFLAGCRGGVLVFSGTAEQQDAALMADLAEDYPSMTFTCTGHPERAMHDVEAADGTKFPAWTAATGRGQFQVSTHYFEEWLADNGYFTYLEEDLTRRGFRWEYEHYNHYDHFSPWLGELTDPDVLAEGIAFLQEAHERYELLMADFITATGREELPPYDIIVRFTVEGEEGYEYCYIGPVPDNVSWRRDYAYDDYEHYFDYELYGIPDHAIEKNGLYEALAQRYGQSFDEKEFDYGFHLVVDRVNSVVGEDVTNREWVVTAIDEADAVVTCGAYELHLRHGEMADDGYFWIRSISDKNGNVLHDWEAE